MERLGTIRAMLESGQHSLQSVARCVGCSRQEVHRLAKKHGITSRGGRAAQKARKRIERSTAFPVQDIIAAYQDGSSLDRTGARFGISRDVVKRILLDADTPMRVYSERASKTVASSPRREELAYPYLTNESSDPTGLLSLVNSLIPPQIPHFIRADVCQDVLLGILEGTIAPGELKASVPGALKRVRKMHPSLFGPISLDRIIPGTDGLRMIDTIPTDREHF